LKQKLTQRTSKLKSHKKAKMENASYASNCLDSQEMNTNQFLDSLDTNTIITIRKVATSISEFGTTCDSIAGSPDNGLTTSWDGSNLR